MISPFVLTVVVCETPPSPSKLMIPASATGPIGPREQQRSFRKRYTEDFEAYKLYIRGRYYWNKRDVPDLQHGLSYFQQAIDRDPTYALDRHELWLVYLRVP